MTDSGSSPKLFVPHDACKYHGLRQLCTRSCTHRTKRKAERFLKTIVANQANAIAYGS